MNVRKTSNIPRAVVILMGFDATDTVVAEENISLFEYYDQLHAILDDDVSLRLEKGIRRVVGKIYNEKGELDQEFENDYDGTGKIVRSRIVFADGTISER